MKKNVIKNFSITNLHGRIDVDVPIDDNRLVLVGNNGQGKTTFINFLYFVLSQQWNRLLDFEFEKISIAFAHGEVEVSRETLQRALPTRQRLTRAFSRLLPVRLRARLNRQPGLVDAMIRRRSQPRALQEFAIELGISQRHLAQLLEDALEVAHDPQGRLFDQTDLLGTVDEELRKNYDASVLYLPTYRRIERDLKAIFPEMEEEVRRFRGSSTRDRHVELVEFGMEDVDDKLGRTVALLKDAARAQLNSLAGSYLRDVLRDRAHAFDSQTIRGLSDVDVNRILERVEEHTLEEHDRARLRDVIGRIKNGETLEGNDRFVAHYFEKLYEIHLELSRQERGLQEFASVCTGYLTRKLVHYDDTQYQISVVHEDDGSPIDLSCLSSGEKQIISLFAHLYLDSRQSFAVLIDEPELSLSVEWQKTLLPDITDSGRCPIIVAATHSPFIFENEFDCSAKDLSAHVRPTGNG